MSDNTQAVPMSWWPVLAPYITAATFPIACLQYVSFMFADANRELHVMILIGWLVVAIWGVAGIAICLQRGSKQQQLAAILSIPAFVPITAICSVLLYWSGYWQ